MYPYNIPPSIICLVCHPTIPLLENTSLRHDMISYIIIMKEIRNKHHPRDTRGLSMPINSRVVLLH